MKAPEELIQKYMDGVLTPEEDTEIRNVLTEDELSRIKTEKGLYDEILKRIADAPSCPQLLWGHIKDKINSSAETAPPAPVAFPSFLSFAAMLVIGFGILGLILYSNPPGKEGGKSVYVSKVQFASTIPAFASQAKVLGDSQDLIANLEAHGFDGLDISKELVINGHKLKPLGLDYCSCANGKDHNCKCDGHMVCHFLFECCGQPIIVLVSKKDAPISAASFKMEGINNFHITSKEIGDFKLVAAGMHPPGEVLKLFSKRSQG